MGDADGTAAMTMVPCAACGDVVPATAACPTCGSPQPGTAGSIAAELLDQDLLDRVDVALAAQSALARHTAAQRMAATSRLSEEALVLQRRLRRQEALLRARLAVCRELMPEVTEALRRVVGALESESVSGPEQWRMSAQLPRDRSCAAVARRLLEGNARQELGDEAGETATLIASELVTNAFLHGQGSIMLSVRRTDDVLRIEVRDEGRPDRIEVVPAEQHGDGGRGLWIVEQLASDWGATEGTGQVWAEIRLDR
jgi:anti-sigma regulatory factor (Ser/Thr protein kinase)